MRGIDYRSSDCGITLVIAKSFTNKRTANQGLHRVGRYGDWCQRIIVEGISLIDHQEETDYYTKLLAFCNENIGEKV